MDRLQECEIPADGASYFPPASGVYDVKPGLSPLGTDFGNGPADGLLFQHDLAWSHYRAVKELARAERLGKYYQTRGFGPEVAGSVCRFILERLAAEHPGRFALAVGDDGPRLRCLSSGETLRFDAEMSRVTGGGDPAYADPFDALASQVQEDLAVMRRVQDRDWVCAIHLCCPYRWTAEDKIGLDFVTMHLPVPGMENVRRPGMVNVMVRKGPLVRFVWELTTDTRLNHHPEPPPGVAFDQWRRRPFDPERPRLFLRIEREVIWSFPAQEAALFAVRVSFLDGAVIRRNPGQREALAAAIASMGPASLQYKGLAESRDAILAWLCGG